MRLAIYGLTVLGSAFLLFAVQPMVGKELLPRLGGVPGAWTACLLFFQAALLAGYGYVWLGARVLPPRMRIALHLALIALPIVLLVPFAWPTGFSGLSPTQHPAAYALAFLALNVGAAFTLLSATGPLLQDWFAHAARERPYFLYAASNAGSLGALLAYPFLLEPYLDLATQQHAFRIGYAIVALGIVAAGIYAWRRVVPQVRDASIEPLSLRRRLRWLGLAFVPTMLLCGASNDLSLDLAPIPLLWVLPLAVYLASFVVAFLRRAPAPPPWLGRAACLAAVVLVFATVTHANEPVWLLSILHVAFLGAASWIAHRRLADDAPDPRRLPEFYAWIAFGGVLGTIMSAVLAPAVLPDLWEYPVAIALACSARELSGVVREDRKPKSDVVHVLAVAALTIGAGYLVPRLGIEDREIAALVSFGPPALYAYRWMPLRRRYTLCLLALIVAGSLIQDRGERRLTTRSFFGVLRVVDAPELGERHLLHGTTLHGSQRSSERGECVPLAYYVHEGPLGWAFDAHRARGRYGRTLVIGLGTGSIACYAMPSEPWRFLEINPDVVRIARDPRWFTYLRESRSDDIDVRVSDGRLGLTRESDRSLSILVIDAFNSDSVPVHLLTREALRLYLRKLQPGGWVVIHLSNRVLNLASVLGDVAAAEGASARLAESEHATWAVVARRREDLAGLDARWRPLGGVPRRAWRDSFSSLWSALSL